MRTILFLVLLPATVVLAVKLLPIAIVGLGYIAYRSHKKEENEQIWADPERW